MRDLDNSLGFNFSRFNSNGWQNFALDDASQDMSLMNRNNHTINNTFNNTFNNNNNSSHSQLQIHFSTLLNEPPQPATSIYNCIES